MQENQTEPQQRSLVTDHTRLLVSAYYDDGLINQGNGRSVQPVQVQRGMSILSTEGTQVGKVAAVVVSGEDGKFMHLLLGRLPHIPEYRLVPLGLIAHVDENSLQLVISSQEIDNLPLWHSSV